MAPSGVRWVIVPTKQSSVVVRAYFVRCRAYQLYFSSLMLSKPVINHPELTQAESLGAINDLRHYITRVEKVQAFLGQLPMAPLGCEAIPDYCL